MNQKPKIYLGNHNYSSWSLRPWLCLRWAAIDFDEELISLAQQGYAAEGIAQVAAVSFNRKVPALHVDGQVIWDSLSIIEWAAETAPQGVVWPSDWRDRALARSAVCEMHSGFPHLRNDLSMNINRRTIISEWPQETQRDIDRLIELWRQLRQGRDNEGPWLMGQRNAVDAFYAPVMTRFRSYGVELPTDLSCAANALFSDPDFLEWEARPVTDRFAFVDDLYQTQ